jgi:Trp operon repressor
MIQPEHRIANVPKEVMSRGRIVTELLKDDVTDSALAQHLFHSLQRIQFKSLYVQFDHAYTLTL